MRLINTTTLKIEEFSESERPTYAILSHTWEDEEVTFQDMEKDTAVTKKGYDKIVRVCRQASTDKLDYAWVDTCCIDKTSSAELSEAINSMFRWYERAVICYAYLADVPPNSTSLGSNKSAFAKSRWFTRGWTLQELLAPREVDFFGAEWTALGSRTDLAGEISNITRINAAYLYGGTGNINPKDQAENIRHVLLNFKGGSVRTTVLQQASVAERMSWAAYRTTTRPEDIAYSLLGIFNIHMPLLYGEGDMAFRRLQEEIMKRYNDQSLLAWGAVVDQPTWRREPPFNIDSVLDRQELRQPPFNTIRKDDAILIRLGLRRTALQAFATSPLDFRRCGHITSFAPDGTPPIPLDSTVSGISTRLPLSDHREPFAALQCGVKQDPTAVVALRLLHAKDGRWHRSEEMVLVDRKVSRRWSLVPLILCPEDAQPNFTSRDLVAPFDHSIFLRDVPRDFTLDMFDQSGQVQPQESPMLPSLITTANKEKDEGGPQKEAFIRTVAWHQGSSRAALVLEVVRFGHADSTASYFPSTWVSARFTDHNPPGSERSSHQSENHEYIRFEQKSILYTTISRETVRSKTFYMIDLKTASGRLEIAQFHIRSYVYRLYRDYKIANLLRTAVHFLQWLSRSDLHLLTAICLLSHLVPSLLALPGPGPSNLLKLWASTIDACVLRSLVFIRLLWYPRFLLGRFGRVSLDLSLFWIGAKYCIEVDRLVLSKRRFTRRFWLCAIVYVCMITGTFHDMAQSGTSALIVQMGFAITIGILIFFFAYLRPVWRPTPKMWRAV